MRTLFRFTSLLIILLFVFACRRSISAQEQSLTQWVDSLGAQLNASEPGVAILICKDGKTIYAKGFGLRDLRTRVKIDAQTNFRLASLTKQFTATAILLLVHDGKLHYEDRLSDIFPGFPAYGKAITVRNLLTHTSGLPDYEELMEKEEKKTGPHWNAEKQIHDDEVLALLGKESKGKFAPGTSWDYSNSGYVVLGLIVAKVSGIPFGDFLQQRIFSPLDMKQTRVFQKGKSEVPNRAFGHSRVNDAFKETDQSSTSATLGDGGIYSNLLDLAKWDAALHNHTLLSDTDIAPAFTPVKLADGSQPHWPAQPGGDNLAPSAPVDYGFGWFLNPHNGHERAWHSGTTTGFRNVIQRFTKDGITVVVLTNREDLDPGEVSLAIVDRALENEN